MQYLMAPLEQHFDYGFGMVAEAFREAAATLRAKAAGKALCEHLPQNYLLRHAVELYLKSGIVIIHRRLKVPFGERSSEGEPAVRVGDEWKPFYKVHSVADLYGHWKDLIAEHGTTLRDLCERKPDWTIPNDLDGWIATIETTDPGSTYYRYPVTRDRNADRRKSAFKDANPETLFSTAKAEGKRVRALVVRNEAGDLIRAYALDESTEEESTDALLHAAELLSCYHAMMRIEITGGW